MKIKAEKKVQVIARFTLKKHNNAVVYLHRSSDGETQYTTTLINGKATGCSCPAYKKCYHREQLEQIEAARQAKMSREAYNTLYDPCLVA